MENTSKAIETIIKDFKANDTSIVLDAIKRNRKEGNAKSFQAMLDLLKDTDEPLVEEAVISFIFDLKDNESVPVLVSAIQNKDMEFYHSFLIAAFWQSAIDGSDYIDLFVKMAIQGDYMVCLEALTVVENFDAAYPEADLLDFEADIEEAYEKEESQEKKLLLKSLADVIRNLPIEGE
ncbi:MAG: hypothetical protein DWP98_01190 [Bacteroidetes bacterium]|nr:MAG: hypothetical protein DWP98_01190 [Bacteroidota bacterium]MBL1143965.1 hypothetical protein [Bacteroidota bacterium]MCB0802039.1 hypothetical protein [Flavobacteriales bacterium]NOG56766.1 hypothetical protein [Bacteroidota bacterium]